MSLLLLGLHCKLDGRHGLENNNELSVLHQWLRSSATTSTYSGSFNRTTGSRREGFDGSPHSVNWARQRSKSKTWSSFLTRPTATSWPVDSNLISVTELCSNEMGVIKIGEWRLIVDDWSSEWKNIYMEKEGVNGRMSINMNEEILWFFFFVVFFDWQWSVGIRGELSV